MKLRLLFGVLLVMSTSSFASKDEECEETQPSPMKTVTEVMKAVRLKAEDTSECPNRAKFDGLCMFISGRTKDSSGRNDYLYQTRILDGACVKSSDSEKVKNEKIQKAWKTFEPDLNCTSIRFDVTNGHLLKFAVANRFDEFLEDAIFWKVNLNRIDASDNRTLLDYVKFHIERNKGNSVGEKLKIYYKMLQEAGAKHKSEL